MVDGYGQWVWHQAIKKISTHHQTIKQAINVKQAITIKQAESHQH
jgi:hypothetical protein